jgi:hypothetical protein
MVKALEHHVRACRVASCANMQGKRRAGSDSIKQFMLAATVPEDFSLSE